MAIFSKKEQAATTKQPTVASTEAFPAALLGPRISEKSSRLADAGKYVFNVLPGANKVEIKKAVERSYKVNVVQINILSTKGKVRNTGRISGKTSGFKKAIVTLKEGQKIEGATETI